MQNLQVREINLHIYKAPESAAVLVWIKKIDTFKEGSHLTIRKKTLIGFSNSLSIQH